MHKKPIFTWLIWTFIFSLFFWYTLVFAWSWIFDNSIKLIFKSSDNIFVNSRSLNKILLMFNSSYDLKNFKIISKCNSTSKILWNSNWNYLFELNVLSNDCENENFVLVNENNEEKYSLKFNIISDLKIISKIIDLKTEYINTIQEESTKKTQNYSIYKNYNKDIESNYLKYYKNNRIYKESLYTKNIIDNILQKRKEKYLIPVNWYSLPTNPTKLPNSWRPYRKDYTDWIHHWWDIDWNFWEQVIALDDGIIIRVIDNFKFSDLDKIKKWDNLTKNDFIKNLDILRWNQVWLKTMSWDVIFYSHLDEIFSNIKVWEIIKKWQPLWTIWITWVPDKSYTDYHLHFEVQRNPFNLGKNDSYDIDDYMKWDRLFKWESLEYILENQWDYFQK